jgi:hypothetical protein
MNRLLLYGFSLLLGLLVGCKKENGASPVKLHQEFAGMQPTRYVVYEAEDIYHDDNSNIHDTAKYYLKTVVGDPYEDNSGRSGYEIKRYKSLDQGQTWTFLELWYAHVDVNRFESVEDNVRLVRLIFPPKNKSTWNLNSYNTLEETILEYKNVFKPFELDGQNFDTTLTIQGEKLYTLVDYKRNTEVYAKGVGLVYRYFKDLTINNFDTLEVRRGTESFLKLIDYGFE